MHLIQWKVLLYVLSCLWAIIEDIVRRPCWILDAIEPCVLQGTSEGMSGGILIPMDGTSMQDYAATVTVRLVEQDILELQLLYDLATSSANTHLSLTSMAAQDTAGNRVVSVDSSLAIQVTNFTADVTPPQLERFDLDLDSGFLNLTFNEVIDAVSFTPTLISFSSSNNTLAAITLTDGTPLSGNGIRIDIALAPEDLNTLKSSSTVANARRNTYMLFDEGAVTDAAGNNITAFSVAVRVGILVADSKPPFLMEFNVDIGAREIMLVFDELTNASTFSSITLTLINSSTKSSASKCVRIT